MRTKKQFIAETNRDLTDAECAEFWALGKEQNISVRSQWSYAMGHIGSCKLTIENSKTFKSKDFDKHPDWRPLGHYSYNVKDYDGTYDKIEGYVQSWDAMMNISETASFTIHIMKHPHQLIIIARHNISYSKAYNFIVGLLYLLFVSNVLGNTLLIFLSVVKMIIIIII